MRPSIRAWILAFGLFPPLLGIGPDALADGAVKKKQFMYVLHLVPRLQVQSAWTDADNQAVDAHFERLKAATEAGTVILAGRTSEPLDKTFGIVIFEATDAEAARRFMDEDPAVVAGAFTATLHPYAVSLIRKGSGN